MLFGQAGTQSCVGGDELGDSIVYMIIETRKEASNRCLKSYKYCDGGRKRGQMTNSQIDTRKLRTTGQL